MLDFSEKGNITLGEYIEREEIASVDLKFCDLAGYWHHKTLPADGSIGETFEKIIGVDGSSIPQFAAASGHTF